MFQIENHLKGDPHLASAVQSTILNDKHWASRQVKPKANFDGSNYMETYYAQIDMPNTQATSTWGSNFPLNWVLFVSHHANGITFSPQKLLQTT